MNLKGQHILSTKQFDREGLLGFFGVVSEMEKILKSSKKSDLLSGKILASLFFEPSTRTRFSFEAAMIRLGGSVISGSDMLKSSSVSKGESLEDMGKVVSQIADVIAMRHPETFSVERLASKSDVPVINAGDGIHEHPTQALLDVYTIWKEKGTLDNLKIGIIGDLKYGRVPHSQCDLLKHFDTDFVFISPKELAMPEEVSSDILGTMHELKVTENLEEVIADLDVISCTRIQKERFSSEEEYKKYAGVYVVDNKLMAKAKENSIVIHPLPRVDEIAGEVDNDPRAKYFDQVGNGVAVRMGLLASVLGAI